VAEVVGPIAPRVELSFRELNGTLYPIGSECDIAEPGRPRATGVAGRKYVSKRRCLLAEEIRSATFGGMKQKVNMNFSAEARADDQDLSAIEES